MEISHILATEMLKHNSSLKMSAFIWCTMCIWLSGKANEVFFFRILFTYSSYLPDNVHGLFHSLELSPRVSRPEREIFNKSWCFAQHVSDTYYLPSLGLACIFLVVHEMRKQDHQIRVCMSNIYKFRQLFSSPSQLATIHIILVFLSLYFANVILILPNQTP